MRKFAKAMMNSAAIAAVALTAAAANAGPRMSGEERLSRLLEGREAGRPVSCLTLSETRDQQVIDKTAIVYGSGRTIFVNRTSFPRQLDSDDVLVSKIHGSQVCRLDVVRLHDRSSQMYNGFVSLEDFVPYTRVSTAAR
jgi:hypothetical protein